MILDSKRSGYPRHEHDRIGLFAVRARGRGQASRAGSEPAIRRSRRNRSGGHCQRRCPKERTALLDRLAALAPGADALTPALLSGRRLRDGRRGRRCECLHAANGATRSAGAEVRGLVQRLPHSHRSRAGMVGSAKVTANAVDELLRRRVGPWPRRRGGGADRRRSLEWHGRPIDIG